MTMWWNLESNRNMVKIKVINKPKTRGSKKIRIEGEVYYLITNEKEIIIFKNTKDKDVTASIFNIEECKNKDYIALKRAYVDENVEYHEGWYFDNYVVVRILDEVFKRL